MAGEVALQKYNEYLDKASEVEGKAQNTWSCNTANTEALASGAMNGSWKSGGKTYKWNIQCYRDKCYITAILYETRVSFRFRYFWPGGEPPAYEYTYSEHVLRLGDCIAAGRSPAFKCKK